MRIAHLSDLHLLDLEGAVPGRLFNKRLTGYANLRLRRNHKHKPEPVRLAARSLAALGIDHLVITGDVSNLALEREFDRVRDLLEGDVGLSADQISLVPGNHDAYTRGSVKKRRFLQWFAPYLSSDLHDLADESGFPFVRLRGPAAFIGLSTAVSRPPFVASGQLGQRQLDALGRALEHPEVRSRTPVLLQHHPITNPTSTAKTLLEGLWDAPRELHLLRDLEHGLVLHGHWHRRQRTPILTSRGEVQVMGATSASLLHDDPQKMAGFNVYELDPQGQLKSAETHSFDPGSKTFERTNLDVSSRPAVRTKT